MTTGKTQCVGLSVGTIHILCQDHWRGREDHNNSKLGAGGEAEPDTIVVEVFNGEYTVSQKVIGSKKMQYKMKDDGDIEEIKISAKDDK